ncbi:MAG: tetratricopeptide repeat protein [Methanotrichaceae archaeon]|nr:tetratricopeptide repeat protein [Methanotrichaceae archaeon]
MDPISIEDQDEVDLLLMEIEISQGRGNLVICTVKSPSYRERIVQLLGERFALKLLSVEEGDLLIAALRWTDIEGVDVLIWELPERLDTSLIDALNNFRELFYDRGIPSLVFLTPSALDVVIREAPDFWRYRGGFHELQGDEGDWAIQPVDTIATPFSFKDKDDLLRRKRINSYLLEASKDRKNDLMALIDLGSIHYLLSDYARSISLFEQALSISREIKDRRAEGAALGNLGADCTALGEMQKAIEYHEQALAIAREIEDRRAEGATLGNLGTARAALGDIRGAVELYEEALAIAREIKDRRGEGAALGNLGTTRVALGDPRRALEIFEQALAIAREIKDRRSIGAMLANTGAAYAALGEHRRAVALFEQAQAIAREIGDRRGEANALWNMSQSFDALGDRPKAIDSAEAALAIFEAIESPRAETVRRALAKWQDNEGRTHQ